MKHRHILAVATLLAALFAVLPPPPAAAQGRSLSWPEIRVAAHLDDEGRLLVSERQTMRFSGDWNGGERRFDLRPGQRLDFRGMARLDSASGRFEEMERGDLGVVGHWDLTSRNTVRWRARKPSDPPFDGTTLTYRLDYVLSGVLQHGHGEGRYLLDHEFGFADRDGSIERLSVELTADPAWRSAALPLERTWTDLPPGDSPVTTVDLAWTGAGRPAGVPLPLPWPLRLLPFAASLAALLFFFLRFLRHERRSPRFDPLPDLGGPPKREWLEQVVFRRPAEEIGALWDRAVGAPEVTALLARMTGEGKLRSWVTSTGHRKKPTLHLELKVARESLKGAERTLVDGLFFDGRTGTDTERVKEHYKSSGFNPAAKIRPDIEKRLPKMPKAREIHPPWRRWLSLELLAAAVLLFALGVLLAPAQASFLLGVLPVFVLAGVAGLIVAALWRNKVHWPYARAGWLLVPALFALATITAACSLYSALAIAGLALFPLLASAALLPVVVLSSTLYRARNGETADTVHLRRRLVHARDYLERQLGRPDPQLEDAWLPYLLAFGLSPQVEGWEQRWGVAARDAAGAGFLAGSAVAASSGSSSSSAWTGGGGTFGGAGASSAWTAAAAGMASGVAAPSSSGSGGGGGGGSSGGGGGGGW